MHPFLTYVTGLPSYQGQAVHVQSLPPQEARFGSLEDLLHPQLQERLEQRGLFPLYRHQAQAINAARSGRNVIVATGTASGKTLCYNVPVLDQLLKSRGSRALYLFPTKALAQDQVRHLGELTPPGLPYATFDGDTPSEARADIRRSARIILTNPDMLHLGILPNHRSWSRFLSQLRFVVIDEAHTYRGVFGSQVALVLRRLRRLCRSYGSQPVFIASSATLANPQEHIQALTGVPFEAVHEDSSPHGSKDFVFWNPPIIDQARAVRRSASAEATFLLAELIASGVRTLAFARTRRLTELIYLYTRERLEKVDPALANRFKPYRAGYLPEERRALERQLFQGQLLGVVATTALELGIDIGDLAATVLTGYPGSIASTWQQAGRSGRGREPSLSVLIGRNDPLDQYFLRHPDFFFAKSPESALVNPANPHILKPHLLCAAWELPLSSQDREFFGDLSLAQELAEAGLLHERGRRWYLSPQVNYPAQGINLRSITSQTYAVTDASRGALLETVEGATAFFLVHPGAIYLHQGESYLVESLDLTGHTAYVRPTEAGYYTQTKDLTEIRILSTLAEKPVGKVKVYLGEVEVTTTVVAFQKKRVFSEEVVGEEPLDLPPQSFATVALWFDLPQGLEPRLAEAGRDWAGGLHGAEHAAIGILPLFALCDRNDIGGVSTPLHPDTGRAQLFIYDGYPGGIGIAQRGFEIIAELWRATLEAIRDCPCEEGCPSCIQSPKCGNNNQPLDKAAARAILESLQDEDPSYIIPRGT